jgi:Winged helix-turn helix
MKPPLYIRPLTPEERQQLEAGLRASDAFALRRCQILLASARGQRPAQMARQLSCAAQSVRNAIHTFHTRAIAAVHAQSRRPRRTRLVLEGEPLRALLHERPRAFGKPYSTWTLRLAAEVCWERGLTPYPVSIETIRHALKRLGVQWRRAKRWITSPDPQYALKKTRVAN